MPSAQATTQRALATAVGKSQPAIVKWIRDPRWPFARTGPWDIEAVRKWAADTLGPNPAALGDAVAVDPAAANDLATKQRLVNIKGGLARAKLTETRDGILKGDYILKSEVDSGRVERIHVLKTSLFDLVDSGLITQMRAADNEQDAKDLLRARFIALCQQFASG